jgi:hypothetical protein
MPDDDKITPEMIEEANRLAYGPKRKKRRPPVTLDEIEARSAKGPDGEVMGMIMRGVMARHRQRRNSDIPFPVTWADLIRNGGPLAYMRAAAARAAKQAAGEEARYWLDLLAENRPDDDKIAGVIDGYIKTLRRIVGERPPIEEVRARTRERVRRFRERRRGFELLSRGKSYQGGRACCKLRPECGLRSLTVRGQTAH